MSCGCKLLCFAFCCGLRLCFGRPFSFFCIEVYNIFGGITGVDEEHGGVVATQNCHKILGVDAITIAKIRYKRWVVDHFGHILGDFADLQFIAELKSYESVHKGQNFETLERGEFFSAFSHVFFPPRYFKIYGINISMLHILT